MWLSYLLGSTHQYFSEAKVLIDEMRADRQKRIIVTCLMLGELLYALRRITGKRPTTQTAQDPTQYMIDESYQTYQELMDLLTRAPSNRFLLQKCTGIDASQIIDQSLTMVNKYPGRVAVYSTSSGGISSAYKGLSQTDVMHAFLAQKLECQTFYTFDKGFNALKDDSLLIPLDIKVIYS